MKPGVVSVAFGAPDLLARALGPLAGLDVVVVDNSSREDVRAVCLAMGATYVDAGANLGFATGVNIGVRELGPERDVLLLNPDAVLDRAGLDRLTRALHSSSRVAAVSPRLVGPDGEQRVSWPWPTPTKRWREALALPGYGAGEDYLVGAVLLLRAEALREVGGFDERFFLYAEEADWQRRAVDHGWEVQLVQDTVAQHLGAATSTDPRRRETLFHAGGETYVRKWFGRSGWTSYRAASIVGALLRSGLPGSRGSDARRRVVIYARGPRRVAGLDA